MMNAAQRLGKARKRIALLPRVVLPLRQIRYAAERDFDGLAQERDRFERPAAIAQDTGQMTVGRAVGGIDLDRLLELRDGLVGAATL